MVGSAEDIKNEIRKMEMIDTIHDEKDLKELLDRFGFRMTRKYLEIYSKGRISLNNEVNDRSQQLLKELHNAYPIMDYPEKWI
jgi:hypothetical protein